MHSGDKYKALHIHTYIHYTHTYIHTYMHAGDEYKALIREAKRLLYDIDQDSPKQARELLADIQKLETFF